ncbi:endoplasmic reticulum membrane-associated RNA degradation protein [Aplysia californica]|uniref:Endoplasmic reticulum membrane-associated RNA degradation protein n=1 Tax=Aplysia californica TaxID=6500 RepID=A0ABM0K3Z3_APLCA|nr:endoplasmic reticulum membrane-associated RNA degradation protein [Aplysia californica]
MAEKELCRALASECHTTALSVRLRDLISRIGLLVDQVNDHDHVSFCDFLCFERCASFLPDSDNTVQYFENSVQALAPVIKKSQDILKKMSVDVFKRKYNQFFLWTGNENVFMDCFNMLSFSHEEENILCLLLLSSAIERALGNVYLLKGSQCPALLKDLLASSELGSVLGSSTIQILQVLMGPPISLNLRNVAWHGFFSEGELPPRYIYFLLHIVASIGKLLESQNIHVDDIPFRSFVSLASTDDVAYQFPRIPCEAEHSLQQVIVKSWMVNQTNMHMFQLAFRCYSEKMYGKCAVLLFPLLEHALRRLFVLANHCPARLITAEATTLFTTFEEILEKNLSDGTQNMVPDLLGESCMDFLHDLLTYPCGPRARDKLGHGEVDFTAVPGSLCQVLLTLLGFMAARFTTEGLTSSAQNLLAPIQTSFDNYQSIFHSIAILRSKMLTLSLDASMLQSDTTFSPLLESWKPEDGLDCFISEESVFPSVHYRLQIFIENISEQMEKDFADKWTGVKEKLLIAFSDTEKALSDLVKFRVHSLYRWQKEATSEASTGVKVSESEIVGLLTRIVGEVLTCLCQTRAALVLRQQQLTAKQLRSRQRENFKKLLAFVPSISLFCQFVLALSAWLFCRLDHYNNWDNKTCKALQRFLKSALQTSENLRTFTSTDKNKWVEAGKITLSLLETAGSFSKSVVLSPPAPV